jgi:hypothetical protein
MANGNDSKAGKPTNVTPASARAGRVIIVGVLLVGLMLAMAVARLVSIRREYVLERGYRLLDLATSQIADRVDGLFAARSLSAPTGKPEPSDGKKDEPKPRIRFHYDSEDTSFRATNILAGRTKAPENNGKSNGKNNGKNNRPEVPEKVSISDILRSSAYAQQQFDDICVVNRKGRVLTHLFSRTSSDPLPSLGPLVDARKAIMGAEDPTQPSLERILDEFLLGRRKTFATYDAERNWTETDLPVRLLYRRQHHVAFCRPIEWTRPRSIRAPRLALCGLRLEQSINAEVWAISPMLVIGAALVLALAGLGWPILKLRYLGRQERLHARDARVLVLTCIAGVGMITSAIAMVYAHQRVATYFDRDAEEIARTFEDELSAQLAKAAAQLDRFRAMVAGIDGDPDDGACARLGTLEYLDFQSLGWISADGWSKLLCRQGSKGLESMGRPPDKLDNRQYFKDVRANHVWRLGKASGESSPPAVALEPVVTKSTGDVALVLAMSVEPDLPKSEKGLVVMAAIPSAAFRLVLPEGINFALVQDDGKVRIHSDIRRAFHESIFEETGSPPELAAMVTARSKASLSVDYYGATRHRLYVYPLKNTPWTLVVLRDRTIESTALSATAVAWLAAFVAYLSAITAVLIVATASRAQVRLQWFWPASNRGDSYRWMALALVVIGAFALAAGRWGDTPAIVPAALMPVAAMSALHLAFREPGRRLRRLVWIVLLEASLAGIALTMLHRGWVAALAFFAAVACVAVATKRARDVMGMDDDVTTFRISYVALMTLVLFELSAWPSLALFTDAWNGVMAAVVRRAEMQYARTLSKRAVDRPDEQPDQRTEYHARTLGGLRAHDSGTPYAGSGSVLFDAVARALCASPTGMAEDQPEQCRELVALASRSLSSLAFLAVDPYTTPAAELQQLVHERSRDGRWVSQRTDGMLRYTMHSTAYAPTISLEAMLPLLVIPRSAGGYAGAFAIALAIFWVTAVGVRFIVLRLFAIGPRMPERTLRAGDGAAPAIWLFARLHDRSITDLWALGADALHAIDLTLQTNPEKFALSPPPRATDVLVIDRLEARLGVDAWEDRLLTELEHLAATGVDFVLVCATDPIFFLNARRGESDPGNAASSNVSDGFARWMRLLASCASARPTLRECASLGEFGRLLAAQLPPSDQWSQDAWYWHLWATSTQDEKLAMVQLAEEGFLNPNTEDVTRQLFDRGLVFRAPELTFFSPSFHEFVRRVRTPSEVRAWEAERAEAGWARIQRPLMIVIGVIVVFFVLTQPGLYSVVLGVLTAFTTLVPRVVDLLGRFLPKAKPAE